MHVVAAWSWSRKPCPIMTSEEDYWQAVWPNTPIRTSRASKTCPFRLVA